jgi:hypothetical protein
MPLTLSFPSIILNPGEEYKHSCIHRFLVKWIFQDTDDGDGLKPIATSDPNNNRKSLNNSYAKRTIQISVFIDCDGLAVFPVWLYHYHGIP